MTCQHRSRRIHQANPFRATTLSSPGMSVSRNNHKPKALLLMSDCTMFARNTNDYRGHWNDIRVLICFVNSIDIVYFKSSFPIQINGNVINLFQPSQRTKKRQLTLLYFIKRNQHNEQFNDIGGYARLRSSLRIKKNTVYACVYCSTFSCVVVSFLFTYPILKGVIIYWDTQSHWGLGSQRSTRGWFFFLVLIFLSGHSNFQPRSC